MCGGAEQIGIRRDGKTLEMPLTAWPADLAIQRSLRVTFPVTIAPHENDRVLKSLGLRLRRILETKR